MRKAVLSLLILATISPCLAKYSGGSGTAGDPYQIAIKADLLALAADTNDYNKCFILTADIDLDPCLSGGKVFTKAVIAPDTSTSDGFQGVAFSGVFDGAGHKISKMTINTKGAVNDYLGLFGYINGGEIKNLGLKNVSVTGSSALFSMSDYIGGLLGYNDGSVSNCYSTGAVSIGRGLGGLVGYNHSSISNCYSTGTVSSGDYLGGLVGYNNGNISDCYSTNTVSSGDYVGGLVGYNYSGTISSCYSTGTVSGSFFLGGLAGYNDGGSIIDCYSIGTVTGIDYLGGLVGDNYSGTINNCYSTGVVAGGHSSQYLGGLIGYYGVGSISGCYFLSTSGPDNGYGTPLVDEWMKKQESFVGWDFITMWFIHQDDGYPQLKQAGPIPIYPGGSGTEDDPYQIATKADLLALSANSADYGKCFILTADINVGERFQNAIIAPDTSSGYGFNGVAFTGTFDGNGHKITHFAIQPSSESDFLGLFGCIGSSGLVKNLGIEQFSVYGITGPGLYYGGIAGYNNGGGISNCYAAGYVGNGDYIGGLVGYNYGGTISNCHSTYTVSGGSWVGGLVGDNDTGSISDCYSAGAVSGTGAGGLVGINNSAISSCYFLNTSGPDNGYGTPLTDAQMKQQASFVGWDFVGETANGYEDIWRLCNEGLEYPKLAWQYLPGDIVCPDGVNFADYGFFANWWGAENCAGANNCDGADFDFSGTVDIDDLAVMCNNWLSGF